MIEPTSPMEGTLMVLVVTKEVVLVLVVTEVGYIGCFCVVFEVVYVMSGQVLF